MCHKTARRALSEPTAAALTLVSGFVLMRKEGHMATSFNLEAKLVTAFNDGRDALILTEQSR